MFWPLFSSKHFGKKTANFELNFAGLKTLKTRDGIQFGFRSSSNKKEGITTSNREFISLSFGGCPRCLEFEFEHSRGETSFQ